MWQYMYDYLHAIHYIRRENNLRRIKPSRNADWLKYQEDKGTENERKRKKRPGLKKNWNSAHRIQTENLHFKASGNWLMYSLWTLANLCRGLLLDTRPYHKSVIMQIDWVKTCSTRAMTSKKDRRDRMKHTSSCIIWTKKILVQSTAVEVK